MQRLSSDERKRMIVEAALDLFAENGFKRTTTKQIAEKAGISEALMYKHFQSKKELYREVGEYVRNKFKNLVDNEFESISEIKTQRELRELLKNLIGKYYKFFKENPKIIRILMYLKLEDTKFSSLFVNMPEKKEGPLLNLFKRAIEKGFLNPELTPKEIAKAFIGLMNSFGHYYNYNAKDDELYKIVDIFFNGVKFKNQ